MPALIAQYHDEVVHRFINLGIRENQEPFVVLGVDSDRQLIPFNSWININHDYKDDLVMMISLIRKQTKNIYILLNEHLLIQNASS